MAYKNSLITGISDLLVLFYLDKQDSYVYEITKNISNNSNGLLAISQNTIYTSTYKLADTGMISSYSKLVGRKRTRIYYHLEASGRKRLEKLYDEYYEMINGLAKIFDATKDDAND